MTKTRKDLEMVKSEIKLREYDNMYVLWVYTVDPTYNPSDYDEYTIPFIPQRWVMFGTYYTMNEARGKQNAITRNRQQQQQKSTIRDNK